MGSPLTGHIRNENREVTASGAQSGAFGLGSFGKAAFEGGKAAFELGNE